MANFYDYNTRLVHNKYYYGRKMIVLFIDFHKFDRHNILETVLSCVTINSLFIPYMLNHIAKSNLLCLKFIIAISFWCQAFFDGLFRSNIGLVQHMKNESPS